MAKMNAIRVWAGSHPDCSIKEVAAYFDVSWAVAATAIGKNEGLRNR